MRPNDVREFIRRQPFQSFRVTLTDGRSYDVVHPELAMVGRNTVAIGLPDPNKAEPPYDRLITIDLMHIMQIEPVITAGPPSM